MARQPTRLRARGSASRRRLGRASTCYFSVGATARSPGADGPRGRRVPRRRSSGRSSCAPRRRRSASPSGDRWRRRRRVRRSRPRRAGRRRTASAAHGSPRRPHWPTAAAVDRQGARTSAACGAKLANQAKAERRPEGLRAADEGAAGEGRREEGGVGSRSTSGSAPSTSWAASTPAPGGDRGNYPPASVRSAEGGRPDRQARRRHPRHPGAPGRPAARPAVAHRHGGVPRLRVGRRRRPTTRSSGTPASSSWSSGSQFTITFMGRPRPQPILRLRHRATGREFYVVNTHPSAARRPVRRRAAQRAEPPWSAWSTT